MTPETLLTNEALRQLYLDYVNDYLTVEVFAEHHGLSVGDAYLVLQAGKRLHEDYANLCAGDIEHGKQTSKALHSVYA